MAKSADKNKKPGLIKRMGFINLLVLIFLFFLTTLTALVYFKPKFVLTTGLQLYTGRLAVVMASSQYYQVEKDQEYVVDSEGKSGDVNFNREELKEQVMNKRRQEMQNSFLRLLEIYNASPEDKWYHEVFTKLKQKIDTILQDRQVTEGEVKTLIAEVDKFTEQAKQRNSANG